jgi:glycosyl transferase family 87
LKLAATLLALALAAAALRGSWIRDRGSDAIDFYLFWLVGQSATEVPDPWSDEGRHALGAIGARAQLDSEASPGMRAAARHTSLETTGTPLLYASFRAMSTGDYELDYALFHLLSLACACVAVLLLGRSFGWPLWAALLALSAMVWTFPPLASDAWVGNVNQIQLAGLALLVVLARLRPRTATALASGAISGLLALFKPNLVAVTALLLALWLFRRQWRFAALHASATVAIGAVAVAASSAVFGGAPWSAWARAASGLARDVTLPPSAGNLSFAQLIGAPAWAANGAAAVLAMISLALVWRGRNAPDAEVATAGAGVAVPLLCATLAWEHYFLLLTPALLYFATPARRRLFGWGLAALVLVWILPHAAHSPRGIALAMDAGAALLLASSWSLLAMPRQT